MASRLRKEDDRADCSHPACLPICWALHEKGRAAELQAGIKIVGRNINSLTYADDTILMAESEEELKNLLMRVKEWSERAGLNLSIKNTKIIASGPIT